MAGIISKSGFPAEQINDPDNRFAFIELAYNSQEMCGTYAAVWAGGGSEGELWGGGFASYPDPLIALAIQRLLAKFPKPLTLIVYGHKHLWEHIAPKRGHIRPAMRFRNSPFTTGGIEAMLDAAQAVDERRLVYQRTEKLKKGDYHYRPRHAAKCLAMGPAREALTAYRAAHPDDIPTRSIVVEG